MDIYVSEDTFYCFATIFSILFIVVFYKLWSLRADFNKYKKVQDTKNRKFECSSCDKRFKNR